MHQKGVFRIEITGFGLHGCDRGTVPGGQLYGRCRKLDCPDCLTQDFVQLLRQKGFSLREATFTHHAGAVTAEVVDDLLKNERRNGVF